MASPRLDQEPVRERLAPARPQVGVEHAVAFARSGHRARRGAAWCRPRTRPRPPPAGPSPSGRSASDSRRRTRRHSCERIASRAMTSSSNDPVSEALGSSRRAASSSSATSGRPPDRSATRSSRLADARSPSIPSISAASSSRSSGGRVRPVGRTRTGRDRAEVRRPRVVAADDVGLVGADDRQALFARDPRQERDERPGRGIGEVEVLEDEDDRMLLAEPTEQAEDPLQRPRLAPLRGGRPAAVDRGADLGQPRREIGQQADDLGRGRTEQVGEDVRRACRAGPGRSPGRSGRTARRRWPARRSRAGRSSARAARASARWPRRGSG